MKGGRQHREPHHDGSDHLPCLLVRQLQEILGDEHVETTSLPPPSCGRCLRLLGNRRGRRTLGGLVRGFRSPRGSSPFGVKLLDALRSSTVQSEPQRQSQKEQQQPLWRDLVHEHPTHHAQAEHWLQQDDTIVVNDWLLPDFGVPLRQKHAQVDDRTAQNHGLRERNRILCFQAREGDKQWNEHTTPASASRSSKCGCEEDGKGAQTLIRVGEGALPSLLLDPLAMAVPKLHPEAPVEGWALVVLNTSSANSLPAD
mmetsp:Transcript_124240/g.359291  ORF Transcript_124240/g.359291 Transcript_124240/m.359291 type:complete len:256 (-) Transcript_124240:538-1305(-)